MTTGATSVGMETSQDHLHDMAKKDSGVDWDGPHEIIPTEEQKWSFETLKKSFYQSTHSDPSHA